MPDYLDLDALAQLNAAASPPPWVCEPGEDLHGGGAVDLDLDLAYVSTATDVDADDPPLFGTNRADAALIAAMRNAFPELLSQIRHRTSAGDPSSAERPATVTLCGSMRFFDLMLKVASEETLKGNIVIAPFTVVAPEAQNTQQKTALDALHRHKIDMATRVVVVTDSSGYIGASTRAEIAYAVAHGIQVTTVRVEPS